MKKFLKSIGVIGLVVAAGAAVKVFCDLVGVSAAARRMGLDRDCFHDSHGCGDGVVPEHQFNAGAAVDGVNSAEAKPMADASVEDGVVGAGDQAAQ